jgi:hypothetical protein
MTPNERRLASRADAAHGSNGWHWADDCNDDDCKLQYVHSPNCRCSDCYSEEFSND